MKVVIQRVKQASVTINNTEKRSIVVGLVLLLGIEDADTEEDADWLCKKIPAMRIFEDQEGKMNLSVEDIGGDIMVISQFTLHALTKKGNRPSFIQAAHPEKAVPFYTYFVKKLKFVFIGKIETGEFGAFMDVELLNNGPVTIIIDSKNKV